MPVALHEPFVPQDVLPWSVQAAAQQMAPSQLPLAHSVPATHALPLDRADPQTPALHCRPGTQSLPVVQAVLHDAPAHR